MSLVNITPDTDGTTLTLRIQGESMTLYPHLAEPLNMGKFREQ